MTASDKPETNERQTAATVLMWGQNTALYCPRRDPTDLGRLVSGAHLTREAHAKDFGK